MDGRLQKYACFACRKSYKSLREKLPARCPQCGDPMKEVGYRFRAPRQRDVRQWRKVELLVRHGCVFDRDHHVRRGGWPANLRDVPAFLAEQSAARQARLRAQAIRERAAERAARRKRRRGALEAKQLERLVVAEARRAEGGAA